MATQNQQSSFQYPPLTASTGSSQTSSLSRSTGRAVGGSLSIARKLWLQARTTLKGQFVVLMIVILFLSLVEALFVSSSFRQAYSDFDTIGNGSVPSVDAAQAGAQYIEDIDAKAADYLATGALTDRAPCSVIGTERNSGILTVHDCDSLNINAEIILVNQELYIAAHNVTYPGERTAIERITAGFEEYIADIAVMRHEYNLVTNKTDLHDIHLQKALQAYLAASNVLHVHITQQPTVNARGIPVYNEPQVPSCMIGGRVRAASDWPLSSIEDNIDCLNSINKAHLDAAYDDSVNFLGSSVVWLLLICLIVCGVLGFSVWRMSMITHRVINVGLTLALLVGVILSYSAVFNFVQLSGRHGTFGQMVKDDYDSIYAAALLKRYGTVANADESRWLIARAFGDQAEADHWFSDWKNNTDQVNKLIAAAKANRTWPEEDQPLLETQINWENYFSIDRWVRIQAAAASVTNLNPILDAERLSTGASNLAFDAFTQSVDQLSKANRDHYNSTYVSSQASLTLYMILSAILFPLIGLAGAWGIFTRLKEF